MFTHPESWGQLGAVWRFSRKLRDLAGKMSGRLGAVRARCLGWLPEASGLQSVGDSGLFCMPLAHTAQGGPGGAPLGRM